MTKHHEGAGDHSREVFETAEQAHMQSEAEISKLTEKRDEIIAIHDTLREVHETEAPETPYPLSEEEQAALESIDANLSPLRELAHSTEKRLQRLIDKAWDEAMAEDVRRELEATILPEIHKECRFIHDKWERIEHHGAELVRRADAIETEFKVILGRSFRMEDTKHIPDLIKEFFEIQKEMAIMYAAAFSPNLKKKEF